MSDDARAAAERLITPTAHYGTIEEDVRLVLDIKMVATYTLEAADRQAALAAELGRVKEKLADLTSDGDQYEPFLDTPSGRTSFWFCGGTMQTGHKEGCRWLKVVALATALDPATAVAPGAEAGVAETCPDCGHLNHAGRRCLAGCSIWHCSAGRRAVAPGASDAGEGEGE